jgi:UPF0271 protein
VSPPIIDLNCDLGEGCTSDAAIMPLITSANVSCGFHAGDAETAFAALGLARQHGVQVGAHPGFPDREEFGRRELDWAPERVYRELLFQIGALTALAREAGCELRYVKAHGAIYNMACRDERLAKVVVTAAKQMNLALMGLPASQLEKAASNQVMFIAEGFADRRYREDGSLTPRNQPGAFVEDPGQAVEQARRLIGELGIRTLCVHGDNPHALEFAAALRGDLQSDGFKIQAFATSLSV